tara:strand:- start:301 stop:441 length:141 start_codon:yes stop_codon:yes gene_type:complete
MCKYFFLSEETQELGALEEIWEVYFSPPGGDSGDRTFSSEVSLIYS